MDKVFVFGHRKPDTDTVCAAISMAYLMNKINDKYDYIPRVLGAINNETKFVLDYFKVKCPKYLNDVKVQIRDISYSKGFYIDEKATIQEAYELMSKNSSSGIPVISKENNNKIVGLVTLKEIAKELIEGERNHLNTTYENILKVIDGKKILKFDNEIVGHTLTAAYRSTTFLSDVELTKDTILVIGDRHSILEYAIEVGVKLIILVGDSVVKDEHLCQAIKNRVNIISTSKGSFEVGNLLSLANYPISISASDNPVVVHDKDFLTDFEEMRSKLSYSNYPVIGSHDSCLGMIRITDVNNKKRKKVILVDHNEKSQSVDGLEEAEIIEIIDHHRLGTISTSSPINFRNMSVGSTCTIIYTLFKQYNVDIPYDIAGLMFSAVLSDTLLLKSPTTTETDIAVVDELAKKLNIDYQSYGFDMYKASSSISGKSINEIIYQDFKEYNTDDANIGIGQVFTTNYEEIDRNKEEYINELNNISENNHYDIICLFVTDIIKNGSYVYFNDKARNVLSLAYNENDIQQGCFLPSVVSRKKQMVVAIIDVLDKNKN